MHFLFTPTFLKVWLLTVVIFIVLDMLWLGLFASKLYNQQLGYLARQEQGRISFNLPVGLAAQATIATGLAVLISLARQLDPQLSTSILIGALTGLVIYATYDLTNLSFIKDYPVLISVIDIAWGTCQGTLAGMYVWWLWGVVG